MANPNCHSGITGMGKIGFWGLSPAQDLLAYLDKDDLINGSNLRILLIGQVDMRHVLRTVSENLELLTSKGISLDIFIAEDYLEQLARQLVLWELATGSDLGLNEKTRQFMELYGNTLMRPKTRINFVEKLVPKLLKTLREEESHKSLIDCSDMKYREKDELIELIQRWAQPIERYSIKRDWDKRVSLHLGTRYDSKSNIFDWDYQMKLKDRGGEIISSKEYQKWRSTGIGFADFDSDYSQQNTTLVSIVSNRNGSTTMNYLGEIVTGPFITFGIEVDPEPAHEKLYEKVNDKYKKSSFDITYHNLENIFTKLNQAKEEGNLEKIVKFNLISPRNFGKIWMKSNYTKSKFHLIYFGNTMVQHMQPTLCEIFDTNAKILVENAYFALEFRNDQIQLFDEKVAELAQKMKLTKCELSSSEKVAKIAGKTFISYIYSPSESDNCDPDLEVESIGEEPKVLKASEFVEKTDAEPNSSKKEIEIESSAMSGGGESLKLESNSEIQAN